MQYTFVTDFLKQWPAIPWLVGAMILGLLIHFLLFKIGRILARRTESGVDDAFITHCRAPMRVLLPLLFLNFAFPLTILSPGVLLFLKQIVSFMLTGTLSWLIIKLIYVFEDFILSRHNIDAADNLKARQIKTQLQILKKMAAIVVGILALGIILMSFDKVRQLGTSILASAGIASIIVGLAARQSIATLLAGVQIAITQPIRYDDVVIVEGEWGRIEEITLTYVVIRIWDLRRLIIPITYFLEKPFENWTRTSADLLGTVFLYVDYTVPVQTVREELQRILNSTEKWDGRTWGLQVTNTTQNTVELRALMSAADSSRAWELRCMVREKLIEFIQKNYPNALPRVRAEMDTPGSQKGIKAE
ncbi:MAG: mechanosensitive ion channel family protein [Deltaproteobacteria bacterium]|nr:mechanosensitive ion channel family protein [Deltaproteobacteria bacterium]